MEDLTTALLTGVTPALRSQGLVAAAFSLLTVEARHAAWARHLSGIVPVAGAFDRAKPVSEVDRIVASTRFTSTLVPRTTARMEPKFVG
jgi:Ferritin-like domain